MKFRNLALCGSLAGLLAMVAPAKAVSAGSRAQSQNNQQSADAKTVTGKVAAIGSDHKSFSLEVTGGNTLQFVLDQNTQVQGRVSTGTNASVQYQKTDDGKLLALVITPQSSGDNSSPQ